MKRAITCLAALGLGASAMTIAGTASAQEDSPFKWRPAAADEAPRPWAVIIPGGGGLQVFHDTDHYYRWARWLNERGIDVLLVDHLALTVGREAPDGELPGEMLAGFVSQGLAEARADGRIDPRCPGIVMGWSLGGEGMLNLAAGGAIRTPGLVAAVGFYPLIAFQPQDYDARVPVVIFQGEADDTTTLADLQAFSLRPRSERFDIRIYSDAHHGFDAQGLTEPVEWNGGTFLFNEWAARDAAVTLENEMAHWGMSEGIAGCALD